MGIRKKTNSRNRLDSLVLDLNFIAWIGSTVKLRLYVHKVIDWDLQQSMTGKTGITSPTPRQLSVKGSKKRSLFLS